MRSNKHILFLGKRLEAIKTAKKLGIEFSIIQNKVTQKQRKYFEIALPEDVDFFEEALNKIPKTITHIIPVTEFGVKIYERVLKVLNMPNTITPFINECFHKVAMKDYANKYKIPTTPYLFSNAWDAKTIAETLGTDLIVKRLTSSGSRGQITINTIDQIRQTSLKNVLIEKKIYGKEFSIESLVKHGEIVFTNITSYHTHHVCNVLPYPLDFKEQALELNKKIISVFQIQTGIAHVEFYSTSTGLLFGELAIRPPGGYIMPLLDMSYNFSSWETLIKLHLDEDFEFNLEPKFYSACWILHPGKGRLSEIPDLSFLEQDASFVELKNALRTGDIQRREGSGEDYGRILLKNKHIDELLKSINNIKEKIIFKMA